MVPVYELRRRCCPACYRRWRLAGFPATGVPEAGAAGGWPKGKQRGPSPARKGRIADYVYLRGTGVSVEDAAARIGVSVQAVLYRGYESAWVQS